MAKRFLVGFLLGMGLMYWYLNHGEELEIGAENWARRSASRYRGDRHHELAEKAIGHRK